MQTFVACLLVCVVEDISVGSPESILLPRKRRLMTGERQVFPQVGCLQTAAGLGEHSPVIRLREKQRKSPWAASQHQYNTKPIPEVRYHCSCKVSFLFSFSVACSQSSGQLPYPDFSGIALIYFFFFFFLFCARYASVLYLLHSLPAQTGVRFPVKPGLFWHDKHVLLSNSST